MDEADRINDQKIIYSLLEDIFRKVLILITNREDLEINLDTRVKSRLLPDKLIFEPYNKSQIRDILEQRREFAFVKNVWDEKAFDKIIELTSQSKDLRKGLFLMKSSGENAENRSSKKIELVDVENVLEMDKPKIKEVKEDYDEILNLIKENKKCSVRELFEKYGKGSYRTFQRRVKELKESKMIKVKEMNKGFEDGRSNEVEVITLDDF